MIMPAIEPRLVVQDTLQGVEIVERNEVHEVGHRLRNAGGGNAVRFVGRTEQVEAAPLRDHDRIVMAVIRALDLDDLVATGDRPHQVDGIHGRLGAGVVESPQRQTEPSGQVAGDDDRVVGWLGEVGAFGDATLHCGDDRRIGMAGDHHAIPTVQVDVLGAVDIPHSRTASVADPHRRRARDHPIRRRTAGEHLLGLLGASE